MNFSLHSVFHPMNIPVEMVEVSSTLRIEPDWIKFDHCVLRYMCYCKEAVSGSAIENYRVRKFIIKYFLEDKTMEMTEIKDDNSGMLGGTFFKRQQLKHADGHYICPDQDLFCGTNIEVYSRVFRIVAMDDFTRSVYDNFKFNQGIEESIPHDPFTVRMRIAKEIATHRREFPLDIIREKALVNVLCGGTDLNRKVRQFIEKGGKILRFFCVWNDDSEDGYVRRMHLHYFLADDTVEIIEMESHGGKQKLFFKRSVLSKHGLSPVIADKYDERNNDIFTAVDFITGKTVCIGGRNIYVYDCDRFTKDYYKTELGIELVTFADPYEVKHEKVEAIVSEKHYAPAAECDNTVILRFQAIIHEAPRNHASRRFIVSAYPSDDSFSVFETPVRNSGFLPGKFAERARREKFSVKNFRVGSVIVASGTKFELVACDEFTQNHLIQNCD